MTLGINGNGTLKVMASEIANLLDQKETDSKTRSDGKIEGSIWAKYSGTEKADRISTEDATKVIMQDLIDNGVDFIRGVLHAIGIDWTPSYDSTNPYLEQNVKSDENISCEAIADDKGDKINKKTFPEILNYYYPELVKEVGLNQSIKMFKDKLIELGADEQAVRKNIDFISTLYINDLPQEIGNYKIKNTVVSQ